MPSVDTAMAFPRRDDITGQHHLQWAMPRPLSEQVLKEGIKK